MKKKARDIIIGDRIELDCGYGCHEFMRFCTVLQGGAPVSQLFPDEKTKDWLSFGVDDGTERFSTIGFPPDYEFEVIPKRVSSKKSKNK